MKMRADFDEIKRTVPHAGTRGGEAEDSAAFRAMVRLGRRDGGKHRCWM